MGRFNLNQILSDTSKAAAGGGSAKPRPSESRYEKLSVFDLVPSEDNFYSMREIGELKAAIEIAGKVLQNLVVVPLGDGKYKVIAGHRRRLASRAGRLGLQQSAGKRAGSNLPGVRPAVVLHYATCYLGGGHNAIFDLGV